MTNYLLYSILLIATPSASNSVVTPIQLNETHYTLSYFSAGVAVKEHDL